MECALRLSHRCCFFPFSTVEIGTWGLKRCHTQRFLISSANPNPNPPPAVSLEPILKFKSRISERITLRKCSFSNSRNTSSSAVSAGWFLGLGQKQEILPEIVKAGDPVLHEPARNVGVDEIGSEKINQIIDDMVAVMRKAPGVGLAAPQIGIPLKIIVLEDTKEYISYASKADIEEQDRHPFDLLVILNPKLKNKSNKTALFFEGCLSIDGFRAAVERHLEVEVTGLDRDGRPVRVEASGWKARILQHECDHLDGMVYVDKMLPRTFRTVQNLDLPLPAGCPKLGVC